MTSRSAPKSTGAGADPAPDMKNDIPGFESVERPSLYGQEPTVDPFDAVRDDAGYCHVRVERADVVLRQRMRRKCRDYGISGKDY